MNNIVVGLVGAFDRLVRRLPIISGLRDCTWRDHREACKEVAVNFVLSTSPLWLGSLIVYAIDPKMDLSLSGYLRVALRAMSDGELLLFATSAIAPIFYFSLTPPTSKERDYPSRLSHIVSSLLIFMICVALFGAQRAGGKLNPTLIFPMSVYVYVFALTIIYIATVYRNYRDYREEIGEKFAEDFDPSDEQQQEDAFLRKVKEHRSE